MGKIKLLLGASVLISSAVANASLISRDYLTYSDNLITFDTETNLEWLDLTVTQGLSVDEVRNTRYINEEGFRYALGDDVLTLFNHAGITVGGCSIPVCKSQFDETRALIDLMGVLQTDSRGLSSQGWHNPSFRSLGGSPPEEFGFFTRLWIRGDKYAASVSAGEPIRTSVSSPEFGSHLVRTVPEPSIFAIIVTGLIGLGIARRRITR